MTEVRRRRAAVNGVELDVVEAGDAAAPPLVLAHGFPELSHSWRHQWGPLADAGWHVIVPDQRGYGGSSAPRDVPAYAIEHLVGDLLGLVDETGHEQAVYVGHDWGALVVWALARMLPERVRAVVGASVPFVDWPTPPTRLFRQVFGDRFFYMVYFQEVGPADRELDADPRAFMRRILWSASGDAARPLAAELPPMAGTRFGDTLAEPPADLPEWLTEADVDAYAESFARSGFFGPLSWYRNLDHYYDVQKDLAPSRLTMPSFFITGERDPVNLMDPTGPDRMRQTLPGYQGEAVVPKAGHWVQQERPADFNQALLGFLATLT
jgi:pimeloyl-ACP methyl ester carboxylesterase